MKLLKLIEIANILGLNNNFKQIKNNLLKLIEVASILGLNKNDINEIKSLLEYNEFELCFDTLITQMYEYDIKINKDDYELISEIGKMLNLSLDKYSFMLELIFQT